MGVALRVVLAVMTMSYAAPLPREAFAQPAPLAGPIGLSAGLRWTGAMAVGGTTATETAPSGGRYRLFATDTTLAPSPGVDASMFVRLRPSIEAGLSATLARSDLRTRITSDVEGIPDVEAVEEITQLSIEGALLVRLKWRPFERSRPFVVAGGGYLRHLHQGRTFIETGSVYHVGAGIDYVLRSDGRGALKTTGVRFDGRVTGRRGGVAFDDGSKVSPSAGASFFARF